MLYFTEKKVNYSRCTAAVRVSICGDLLPIVYGEWTSGIRLTASDAYHGPIYICLHRHILYVIESPGRGCSDIPEKFQTVLYHIRVRCGVFAACESRDRAEYFTKSFRTDFRSSFPNFILFFCFRCRRSQLYRGVYMDINAPCE